MVDNNVALTEKERIEIARKIMKDFPDKEQLSQIVDIFNDTIPLRENITKQEQRIAQLTKDLEKISIPKNIVAKVEGIEEFVKGFCSKQDKKFAKMEAKVNLAIGCDKPKEEESKEDVNPLSEGFK